MSAMEAEAVEMGQATLLQDSTGHCGLGPLTLTQMTALPTPQPTHAGPAPLASTCAPRTAAIVPGAFHPDNAGPQFQHAGPLALGQLQEC